MGTRRWVAELESWLRKSALTKEELAERSKHSGPHILALFKDPDPNPTLSLFLDLMHAAGARFHGIKINEPLEVIHRLKEIMARENVATVSALAKVAGVNRSQLSSLWNDKEPNPSLATFDRLVVALGAEQDFVLVNFHDAAVAEALTVGKAEVQTMKQEAKIRHLHSVPPLTPRASADAAAARAADDGAVKAKIAELIAQITELHKRNVALEKLRDDQAAEIVRLRGTNQTLERLRAEDAAEIARLRLENRMLAERNAFALAENDRILRQNAEFADRHARDAAELARLSDQQGWSLVKKVSFGLASLATGAAGVYLYNKKRDP